MSEPESIDVLLLRLDATLPAPSYARAGDAGADLPIAIDVTIPPGERVVVPTGFAVAIPPGWVGLACPRSGLAARHGLTFPNAPGVIDSGYRGEIKVCLLNTDAREPVTLRRGDLIAQLVFQRVGQARFVEVDELPASDRGAGGYGSTGGVRGWAEESRPIRRP